MKNKKIIEAYDQMLPGKERHDRNLEEVISRLEAQGYDGTSIYEEEDRSDRSSGAQIITVRKKSWKTVAATAAVLAVVVSLAVNTEVIANVRSWFRHFSENDSNTIVYEFYEDSK